MNSKIHAARIAWDLVQWRKLQAKGGDRMFRTLAVVILENVAAETAMAILWLKTLIERPTRWVIGKVPKEPGLTFLLCVPIFVAIGCVVWFCGACVGVAESLLRWSVRPKGFDARASKAPAANCWKVDRVRMVTSWDACRSLDLTTGYLRRGMILNVDERIPGRPIMDPKTGEKIHEGVGLVRVTVSGVSYSVPESLTERI
jgi:hypothetical protein